MYSSTISVGPTDTALSGITGASIITQSTGTFYSAVNNASSLTSWSTLGVNDTTPGASAITYFTRSSTNSFAIFSATPAWVSQTKNATVSASTGTFFQLRADFTVTAATETPSLNDFAFNWFEGQASDKMYGAYWDYALWFSISSGTVSNNNRIIKFDLLNNLWTLYDIASNGFLVYNNSLYFGSSSVGKLYKFGGVTSDENSAINSYWKSKDFFGATPFQDEDMRTLSWYAKSSSGTVLSVTYQINESTTTSSYNINLFDRLSNVIRSNRNFPVGSLANTINYKIGDNSTNPSWEVYAGQDSFIVRPWNAYP